jgi:hypothetical protein
METLTCPFCGEKDFDKPGLKDHLLIWCDEFKETENITKPRFWTKEDGVGNYDTD